MGTPEARAALERALGVRFRDPAMLDLALTHRSAVAEGARGADNERLEFLGDAVLGLAVADMSYRTFPDLAHGELSPLRAAIVNMNALAEVGRQVHLGDAVMLGRGEEMNGGRDKASILADALEAVIGAVYLDQGPVVAREVIERLLTPRIAAYARGEGDRDFKGQLQEYTSAELQTMPEYRIDESGPDHRKRFVATVLVSGRALGTGEGGSKKEAEQRAAQEALRALVGADRGGA